MSWFSPARPALPPILDLMAEWSPGDEERELQLRRVLAHARRGAPRRLVLPPDLRPEPERGPPCPACAEEVSRAQRLAACPSCLGVFHTACWEPGTRCPCERPARGGVHPLAGRARA